MANGDNRIWKLLALANDPEPYSTEALVEYAAESNGEFDLVVEDDVVLDCATQRGNDGHVVARLWDVAEDGLAVLDASSPSGARRV